MCQSGSSLLEILERTELAWVGPRRRGCAPSLNELALDFPAGEVARVTAPQRVRLVGIGCRCTGLGVAAREVPRMPPGLGMDIPDLLLRTTLRHLRLGRHEFTRVRAFVLVPALDLNFGRPLLEAPGFHSRMATVPWNDRSTGESGGDKNHSGDGKTHIGLCGFCRWDGSC